MNYGLITNIDKLHTTELGFQRIGRVVNVPKNAIIQWCRAKIQNTDAVITKNGKNWYIRTDGFIITVNATSFTIITVHKDC